MRITCEDYMDVIWFAVDRDGHVIVARSMESEIPEFVKCSSERTTAVAERLSFPRAVGRDRCGAFDAVKAVEGCGFYYYIADDPFDTVYRRVGMPERPCRAADLSWDVQELLANNRVAFSAAERPSFTICGGTVY